MPRLGPQFQPSGWQGRTLCVLVHQLGIPVPAFPVLVWAGAKAMDEPRFGLYAFLLSVVAGTAGNLPWFWAGRR